MSSPLDRIEAKMQNRMFGQWPVIHPDTVLALVNVAKAAQEAEDHAQDYWDWVTHYQPKLREALAALDKDPSL